jgi:ABC-2 type transport system permease protein
LRLRKTYGRQSAPLWPLLTKELREITSGRALWTMLLLLCPLVGYSFFQAVSLYGEASTAALQSPVLASSLSPLDGILVPTLGSSYVAVTLLFPFVAIRALGQEKETGALRLLVQLPYRPSTLVSAKLAAVLAAWTLASIPALSAVVLWRILGGIWLRRRRPIFCSAIWPTACWSARSRYFRRRSRIARLLPRSSL